MNVADEISGNEYLFEIATFLVMCVRENFDHSSEYASLRMLNVIEKLADFPQYVPELKEDPFLQQIKPEIEKAGDLVMNDPKAFRNIVNKLVDQFVDEMKKRGQER